VHALHELTGGVWSGSKSLARIRVIEGTETMRPLLARKFKKRATGWPHCLNEKKRLVTQPPLVCVT